jgi:hypothetical protein
VAESANQLPHESELHGLESGAFLNATDHPFSGTLNAGRKFVFSRTLTTAEWANTTIAAVTRPKRSFDLHPYFAGEGTRLFDDFPKSYWLDRSPAPSPAAGSSGCSTAGTEQATLLPARDTERAMWQENVEVVRRSWEAFWFVHTVSKGKFVRVDMFVDEREALEAAGLSE